jgi:hypothetical protein
MTYVIVTVSDWFSLQVNSKSNHFAFDNLTEHHDGADSLLPDHAPKIVQRLRFWPLRCDVCVFILVVLSILQVVLSMNLR